MDALHCLYSKIPHQSIVMFPRTKMEVAKATLSLLSLTFATYALKKVVFTAYPIILSATVALIIGVGLYILCKRCFSDTPPVSQFPVRLNAERSSSSVVPPASPLLPAVPVLKVEPSIEEVERRETEEVERKKAALALQQKQEEQENRKKDLDFIVRQLNGEGYLLLKKQYEVIFQRYNFSLEEIVQAKQDGIGWIMAGYNNFFNVNGLDYVKAMLKKFPDQVKQIFFCRPYKQYMADIRGSNDLKLTEQDVINFMDYRRFKKLLEEHESCKGKKGVKSDLSEMMAEPNCFLIARLKTHFLQYCSETDEDLQDIEDKYGYDLRNWLGIKSDDLYQACGDRISRKLTSYGYTREIVQRKVYLYDRMKLRNNEIVGHILYHLGKEKDPLKIQLRENIREAFLGFFMGRCKESLKRFKDNWGTEIYHLKITTDMFLRAMANYVLGRNFEVTGFPINADIAELVKNNQDYIVLLLAKYPEVKAKIKQEPSMKQILEALRSFSWVPKGNIQRRDFHYGDVREGFKEKMVQILKALTDTNDERLKNDIEFAFITTFEKECGKSSLDSLKRKYALEIAYFKISDDQLLGYMACYLHGDRDLDKPTKADIETFISYNKDHLVDLLTKDPSLADILKSNSQQQAQPGAL